MFRPSVQRKLYGVTSDIKGTSASRMRVMNHNWSATKQRLHPQSVAEIKALMTYQTIKL